MRATTVAALLLFTASIGHAAPGDLRWSVSVRGQAWANPTVAPDGALYLATHITGGVMYALSSAGAVLRTNYVRGRVEHSPALDAYSNLYYVTLPGLLATGHPFPPGSYIASMRATNLSERWRTSLANGSDNSPWLGPSNRVYTGLVADPTTIFATNGLRFHEFDGPTGATNLDRATAGWVACPGVVDEAGRVFFGAEDITGAPVTSNLWPGLFYALNANGAAQWPAFPAMGDFGSPVSAVGGVIYTTCRDKNVYGFRATDGEVVFQRELAGRSWTGCAIGVNTNTGNWVLYTGTQATNGLSGPGAFHAIELDGSPTGRLLWSAAVAAMTFGTPALDDAGNVYYTTSTGELQARRPDGALLWSTNCGAGPGGPTILNDGTIVVGSTANLVLAFEGNGRHLADNVPWPKYKRNLRNTSFMLDSIRDLDPATHPRLVVHSDGGSPFPLPGTNVYPTGTMVWAKAPDGKDRGTQLVCVGWTEGTGDVPASGTTNRLSFVITTNSSLRWLWQTNSPAATSTIPIHITIVMHNEQGVRYDLNPFLFEANRTNLFLFAHMLARRGVKFDFQSDWTFLTAVTNFDRVGRPETGGTNIVTWMERDLGFAIDPHNHADESTYNAADVAELIRRCGATPSGVVGGYITLPVTNSEWHLFQQPMTGAVYTASVWTAGILWGGGSGNHVLDTNTWFSGVYAPRDATNYWQHLDDHLPRVGGYGGRFQIWTNIDLLIAMRDAGRLCTGSLYTCNQMVNMSSLNTAYLTNFEAQLQLYTNKPGLRWVTISAITNIWATEYGRRPVALPWALTNDFDADGMNDGWEVTNFCGVCESDGTGDTDSDEWTDAEEYIAATQPTNSASAFSNDWNLADPDFLMVGIPASSAARRYSIEVASNLLSGIWNPVITNVPGNGGLLQFTLTNAASMEFYRSSVTIP